MNKLVSGIFKFLFYASIGASAMAWLQPTNSGINVYKYDQVKSELQLTQKHLKQTQKELNDVQDHLNYARDKALGYKAELQKMKSQLSGNSGRLDTPYKLEKR